MDSDRASAERTKHCTLAPSSPPPVFAVLAALLPPTFERHVLREAATACALTLGVLLAVTMALFLAELLGEVSEGGLVPGALWELLLLRLPEAAMLVGPLALMLGLMAAFGDLAQHREWVVARGAGARPRSVALVVAALALTWATGLLLVAGWAAPTAAERSAAITERMAADFVARSVRPGQFNELGGSGLSVYAERVDAERGVLRGVFVQMPAEDGVHVIGAREGRILEPAGSRRRILRLADGVHLVHATTPRGLPLERVAFAGNDIELPPAAVTRTGGDDASAETSRLTLPALLSLGGPEARAELHWRLAPVVASLLVAWFGLPVALGGDRGHRFAALPVALVFYLVYSNAVHLAISRARNGEGGGGEIWAIHGVVLVVACLLAIRWKRRW